jgi:hypothetical protein
MVAISKARKVFRDSGREDMSGSAGEKSLISSLSAAELRKMTDKTAKLL